MNLRVAHAWESAAGCLESLGGDMAMTQGSFFWSDRIAVFHGAQPVPLHVRR
jgi:hypothetical protein